MNEFELESVDYDEIILARANKKHYGKRSKTTINILKDFLLSGEKCCRVVSNKYFNNNDCRTTLYNYSKHHSIPVEVFMLYGEVYLIRKED